MSNTQYTDIVSDGGMGPRDQDQAAALDAGPCQRCSGSGRITCGSGTSAWPPRMRTEACPACSGAGAAMPAQAGGEQR